MIQDTHGWVTLHDVAREMGMALENRDAWKAGAEIAAAWECQTGTPPLKDLRVKKQGMGSHCFALYPPFFADRIELILRNYRGDDPDQFELPV